MTGGQFIPGVKIFRDTGRAAIDRYLPQQQTRSSGVRRPNAGTDWLAAWRSG